jgi:hypothetical protein
MTGFCENVGYGVKSGEDAHTKAGPIGILGIRGSVTIVRESETDVVLFSVFEDRRLYRRRLHISRRTAKWYPTPVCF